eukprot:GHVR01175561.1.p1 GENE.GHVR01175561.1~~GHVR01175561.1.p1  ORF type:complete len:143 (+),score=61.11 GHVR01175561.1:246-674(+)
MYSKYDNPKDIPITEGLTLLFNTAYALKLKDKYNNKVICEGIGTISTNKASNTNLGPPYIVPEEYMEVYHSSSGLVCCNCQQVSSSTQQVSSSTEEVCSSGSGVVCSSGSGVLRNDRCIEGVCKTHTQDVSNTHTHTHTHRM